MNIAFIYHDATKQTVNPCAWRGELLYKSIKKTGLHNVELINSDVFSFNLKKAGDICQSSQIVVIQGSPEIDLLTIINYLKSRGKKVVVDIPMSSERVCRTVSLPTETAFSISQMYSTYQNKDMVKVDQSERFRWGLHLADSILVSSDQQQTYWQASAPVRVIPEYMDFTSIRDIVKIHHEPMVFGILSNLSALDSTQESIIKFVNQKYSDAKWLVLGENQFIEELPLEAFLTNLPSGVSSNWPALLSIIDVVFVLDNQPVKGEFYRNLLELMAIKIPWVLNDQKGYLDFSKYGLIIKNNKNWQSTLNEIVKQLLIGNTLSEESYLHSIGQNIDDHIYEIISIFSDIIKIPS